LRIAAALSDNPDVLSNVSSDSTDLGVEESTPISGEGTPTELPDRSTPSAPLFGGTALDGIGGGVEEPGIEEFYQPTEELGLSSNEGVGSGIDEYFTPSELQPRNLPKSQWAVSQEEEDGVEGIYTDLTDAEKLSQSDSKTDEIRDNIQKNYIDFGFTKEEALKRVRRSGIEPEIKEMYLEDVEEMYDNLKEKESTLPIGSVPPSKKAVDRESSLNADLAEPFSSLAGEYKQTGGLGRSISPISRVDEVNKLSTSDVEELSEVSVLKKQVDKIKKANEEVKQHFIDEGFTKDDALLAVKESNLIDQVKALYKGVIVNQYKALNTRLKEEKKLDRLSRARTPLKESAPEEVVEAPVVETAVVEEPIVEAPLSSPAAPSSELVQTPVVEEPVVETPVEPVVEQTPQVDAVSPVQEETPPAVPTESPKAPSSALKQQEVQQAQEAMVKQGMEQAVEQQAQQAVQQQEQQIAAKENTLNSIKEKPTVKTSILKLGSQALNKSGTLPDVVVADAKDKLKELFTNEFVANQLSPSEAGGLIADMNLGDLESVCFEIIKEVYGPKAVEAEAQSKLAGGINKPNTQATQGLGKLQRPANPAQAPVATP